MSKVEIKFQADGIQHQLGQFIRMLDDHPEVMDELYKDEVDAIHRCIATLKKLSSKCK